MRRGVAILCATFALGCFAAMAAAASEDPFDGVAFEWDYEGDDDLGEEAYGEGRSLLAYGKPGRFGFFIRAVVLNNINNNCASFWQLSQPRGSDYPAIAYRQATRLLVTSVTDSEMQIDDRRLRTLRMICRATRILGKNQNNQRKIIRTEIIAAIPVERQAEYNSLMRQGVISGNWAGAVGGLMNNAPTDLSKWNPRRADPVNPVEGV